MITFLLKFRYEKVKKTSRIKLSYRTILFGVCSQVVKNAARRQPANALTLC